MGQWMEGTGPGALHVALPPINTAAAPGIFDACSDDGWASTPTVDSLLPKIVALWDELYVPLADSTPKQDELHEVLDYDFIRDTIVQRIAQGHTQLQETLCDDIARTLLAHPKVRAVQVSTQKPDVYPDCDAVGVEVLHFKERA